MGFVRLRFELFPVAITLLPPHFWFPTRSGNAGERERDGIEAANGDCASAPVAGAACVIEMVGSVTSAPVTTPPNECESPSAAVGGGVEKDARECGIKDWESSYGLSGDGVTSNGSWLGLSCTRLLWLSPFLSLSMSIPWVLTLSSKLCVAARVSAADGRALRSTGRKGKDFEPTLGE